MASDKFEVGDILVCEDGSAHGGYGEGLKVGKIYEVERPNGSGECYLVGNWRSWFSRRFRRATLAEIRKYRKEQGYYKHQFAIGELVVGIAQDSLLPVIGQTHVVSATQSDDEHECFIDIDGGKDPGQHFAAKFRKATPAEAAAYYKAAETIAPTFNLTFTWEGPEKKPLTAHDAPEEISKAISLPNPQCLTSADGREFDIIDWNPKVKTGEVVTVEANLLVKQAKEKSKSFADGLVGAATPKKPKAGDIVVCIDLLNLSSVRENLLVQGKTYRIKQVGSLGALEIEGVPEYWYTSRFRLATPAEAQAFLNAEKQPPKEPGIGYRFLDKEELVVEGDEFWSPTYRRWAASGNWQFGHVGKQVMTYRRRNQFAEGELVQIVKPATQALRDREPKWRDAMDHLDGKVFEMPNVVWCDGWRSVPLFRRGSCTHFQPVHLNWLAPASSKQKAAFQAEKDKKAKVQELEDKMKAIESELAILKGT
jgi:hypothetical protein